MYKHAILALATASGLLMATEPASAEGLPVQVTYCTGEDSTVDVPSPADDMTVGELRERLVAMSALSTAAPTPLRAVVKWRAPSGTSVSAILLDGLRACRSMQAKQSTADAADTTDDDDTPADDDTQTDDDTQVDDDAQADDDDTPADDLAMLGSPDIATMLETLVAYPPACWPTRWAGVDEDTETAETYPAALLDAIGLRELLDAVLAGPVTCAPGTAPTSFFAAPEMPLFTYEPSLMDRLGLSAALDRVLGG
ncbi:hypothetical protein AB0G05_45815 [Nonomuraea wenchangensis]